MVDVQEHDVSLFYIFLTLSGCVNNANSVFHDKLFRQILQIWYI